VGKVPIVQLAAYLKREHETEAEFARRAGIPQQTINRLCRGESVPRTDTAVLIEDVTEGAVRVRDLIPGHATAAGAA